jgi:hypothetical protein
MYRYVAKVSAKIQNAWKTTISQKGIWKGGYKKEGVSKVRDTLFFLFSSLIVNMLVNK